MQQLQINLKFNTKQTASNSKASRVPYLLLCTSGSQVNNFHERPYIQLLGKLWVNFSFVCFFFVVAKYKLLCIAASEASRVCGLACVWCHWSLFVFALSSFG